MIKEETNSTMYIYNPLIIKLEILKCQYGL